jgi:tetratricopeptide (TPR) repeat protein
MPYNGQTTVLSGDIEWGWKGWRDRHGVPLCKLAARWLSALFILVRVMGAPPARAGELFSSKPGGPWETRFMTAPPAEVLAAAANVKAPGDNPAIILFEELVHTYEDAHRSRHLYRQVYKVLTANGVEGWDSVSSGWSPWYEDKPTLRARIVAPGGRAFMLDPKTIETRGVSGGDEAVYSDRQMVRAPLPGVAVGAVVEVEISWIERAPLFEAGTAHRFFFGGPVPVQKARLEIDRPSSLHVEHVVRQIPTITQTLTISNDRARETYESGPIASRPEEVPGQPPDAPRLGYVAYTTGTSWATVAAAYADIVERQIGTPDLKAYVADARKGLDPGRDRDAIIGRLVARLGAEVKYTGIEFGEASIIPRPPAEVLERRYGDCKDKALLLAALLRAAGIPAHLALLDAGFGPDVDPDVPGLGDFDHAIVYVPGPRPLWIDATDQFSALGELPVADQGRLALVAARGTRALLQTPRALSAANLSREDRTISVAEDGKVRVVEISDLAGSAGHAMRADYARAERKQIEERLGGYVRATYKAKTLARWQTSDFYDVAHPLRIELETADAGIGTVTDDTVTVVLPLSELFERLPDFLRDPEGAAHKRAAASAVRTLDYVYEDPHVHELRYKIIAPHGYAPDPLPADETVSLGPARYSAGYHVERDGIVSATFRFDSGKPRLTPAELTAFLGAMKKVGDSRLPSVTFHQAGEAALAAGRVREALAEFRHLDSQHPHQALHASQIARAYLEAGLGAAAREEARRAVTFDPRSSRAQRTLGWVLESDLVGRRLKPGSDPKGAEAAYRKALALDPDDQVARASLVILLEHDADGEHTFRPPPDRLAEVLKLHRELRQADRNGLLINQLLDLLYAERFKEILAEKGAITGNTTAVGIYVAAVGATSGAAEAAKLARALISEPEQAHEAMRLGAAELMALRRYKPAAALFDEAAQRHSNAEGIRLLADRLRTTRRREELKLDDRSAAGVARVFYSSFFGLAASSDPGALDRLKSVIAPAFAASIETENAPSLRRTIRTMIRSNADLKALPAAVIADMIASAEATVEGEAGGVARVFWPGAAGSRETGAVLVSSDGGRFRVLSMANDLSPLGGEALRLAGLPGKGDLERARRLLDFAASDASLGTADEPLSASPLVALWTKGAAAPARDVAIAAAALLASAPRPTEAMAPLLDCRAHPANDRAATACAAALLMVYGKIGRTDDGIALGAELVERFPQSKRAFFAEVSLMDAAHRTDEARALLAARAARDPGDHQVGSALANHLLETGDFVRGEKALDELARTGALPAMVYNLRAWLRLLRGQLDEQTLAAAQRAVESSQRHEASILHTLAATEAELGRPEDAYHVLLEEMDRRGDEGNISGPEWFVIGRIAECYGALEAAREAYAKVERPKGHSPLDTWNLADRRLRVLAAAHGH